MNVYKRGKAWSANFWVNGKHIQKSTKARNKRSAENIAAGWRTAIVEGRDPFAKPAATVPTFAEFAKRFRKEIHTSKKAKPKTISYYDNGLNRLLEFDAWRDLPLDEVNEELIGQYVAARQKMSKRSTAKKKKKAKVQRFLQVSTINREIEVLRRLLRVAKKWKVIKSTPEISRLPGERVRDRILDHAEEETYLAAADPLLREIAGLILDTGMRPEEVFRMEWPNVHFTPAEHARFGYIFNPFGKTKYARRNIPLTRRVQALLEMRHEEQGNPSDGWVFPAETKSGRVESLKSQHARALKDSNVAHFVLYSLRHTMLTRLGEAGADAFAIQTVAGHSSILISQRYVHPTPERIENAFSALEVYNSRKTKELADKREIQ